MHLLHIVTQTGITSSYTACFRMAIDVLFREVVIHFVQFIPAVDLLLSPGDDFGIAEKQSRRAERDIIDAFYLANN